MQNIDKIAIVTAAVVLVGGILFATLREDLGKKYADEIQHAAELVDDLKDEQRLASAQAPGVEQMVRAPFQIDHDVEFPEWTFYRRTAFLHLFEPAVVLPPVLTQGRLSTVEVVRINATKTTIHRVSARRGDFLRAELISEILQISDGEGGEWKDVQQVPGGEAGTDFAISVPGLEPNHSYRYRVLTRAKSTSTTPFPEGGDSITSGESGSVEFPPNTVWRASGAQVRSLDAAGEIVPGRVTIQFTRWNWAEGRTERSTDIVREPDRGVDGGELFGTGYALERIEEVVIEGRKERRAVLRKLGDFQRLYLINNLDPSSLEPSGWVNDESEESEEPSEESDEADEATEIPEIPDTNAGGGGLFGGDDD